MYTTSFCNKPHLDDGRPVNHECYKLPAGCIAAERAGDYGEAQRLIDEARRRGRFWPHRGVKAGTLTGQPD